MRNSSICCTHSKPINFGIAQTEADEKLEFVEHVLGVLIESRFGYGNPYARLGEPPVTTGHSQMFANVKLLTEAEIEANLNPAWVGQVPFYATAFLGRKRGNHLRQRVVVRDTESTLLTESDAASDISAGMLPALHPPAHAGGSPLARGSPTFIKRAKIPTPITS